MAFIIVSRGGVGDMGKVFALNKPVIIVGRRALQSEPDIELSDEVVSRRHMERVLGVKLTTVAEVLS